MSETQEQTAVKEDVQCICMGSGPHLTDMLRKLGPEAAWDHFRNARIEVLKGIRELIDQRIAALSRQEKKGTPIPVD